MYRGRQNIAPHGYRDEKTSTPSNQGNFIELLKLIAEFNEGVRIHLEVGKKNTMYTSNTTQNQVIDIMGNDP